VREIVVHTVISLDGVAQAPGDELRASVWS
jgi:hypothetical protein